MAWLAALALLGAMATDWYGTAQGDEARRVEETAVPRGGQSGEIARELDRVARERAEEEERNGLQPLAAVDSVILGFLIGSAALAFLAFGLRAAGRRPRLVLTPSGLTAAVAAAGAVLLAYRIVQEPGLDSATTVKGGALLALAAFGVLALAASRAADAEEKEPEEAIV